MSVKNISVVLCSLLMICTSNIRAQKIDSTNLKSIKKAVEKMVGEHTIVDKVKDSTAIYSYAFTINVERKKNNQTVTATINNPEALLFLMVWKN